MAPITLFSSGGMSTNHEFPLDPPSPPSPSPSPWNGSRMTSPRKANVSFLDLQSLDTHLIPEIPALGLYDAPSSIQRVRVRSLDESDPYPAANRIANRANPVAKIKVVVRKRPLNIKERAKEEADIITTKPNSNGLTVHETKLKVDLTEYVERHEFVFDAVLNEHVSNEKVYSETVEPFVPLVFQKTKATCFAYGQTGSGKTYTMQPLPLRASRDILALIQHTYKNKGYQLFVSFFEIYKGKLFDLLNDRKSLCMREDGKKQVCIVGLNEYKVSDTETIADLIEKGNAVRSTGITGANEESSRSHAILQLAVKQSADAKESKSPSVVGKLSFIDLAGSERGADTTDNDKQTRMEGAEINKSLLALKECIRALDNSQNHIPFRGSKLTEVLRDSFVGNSRTVMISCVSPNSGSCEHTLNTLRYADRVKSLSKGNNSKREMSSITPKGSQHIRSNSTSMAGLEDRKSRGLSGRKRHGLSSEFERETPPSPVIERVHSGRLKNSNAFSYADNYKGNKDGSDNDLNALLKEEEELVAAHKSLVVESIELVGEEMSMLIEVDQPGNQLDDYIFKMNSILSQKAVGILKLQTQLANFKRRLNEHNVLVSSSGE